MNHTKTDSLFKVRVKLLLFLKVNSVPGTFTIAVQVYRAASEVFSDGTKSCSKVPFLVTVIDILSQICVSDNSMTKYGIRMVTTLTVHVMLNTSPILSASEYDTAIGTTEKATVHVQKYMFMLHKITLYLEKEALRMIPHCIL